MHICMQYWQHKLPIHCIGGQCQKYSHFIWRGATFNWKDVCYIWRVLLLRGGLLQLHVHTNWSRIVVWSRTVGGGGNYKNNEVAIDVHLLID